MLFFFGFLCEQGSEAQMSDLMQCSPHSLLRVSFQLEPLWPQTLLTFVTFPTLFSLNSTLLGAWSADPGGSSVLRGD